MNKSDWSLVKEAWLQMTEDINIFNERIDDNMKKITINNRVYNVKEDGSLDFTGECEKKNMVSHPAHYGGADNPYEAIKVIEAWGADFNIGSALRYLCRCGKKTIGGSSEEMRLEDLKKARWYIDREIYNIEHESDNPYQE